MWNSPLLVVPKKSSGQVDSDDITVCLDLRVVNALTKDSSNILPSLVELFEHVQGVKYFTEINLTEAYHHIVVSEKSQPLLGFLAPDKSQYVYVRIFFFFFFEINFIQLVVFNLSHLNYIKLCLFLTSNKK